jgi:hypothetical protein
MRRVKPQAKRYLLACLSLVLVLGFSFSLLPKLPDRAARGVAWAGQAAANPWYFLVLDRGQKWQTTFTLTNLEAQELGVSLSAYAKDGAFLGALPFPTRLESQAAQTLAAREMLPPGSDTLKVEATGQLAGSVLLKTQDGTKAEALPALQDASQQLDFPPLLQEEQKAKTITLLNPDSSSAALALIALDSNGAELSRTGLPSLPPMASHTLALQDLFSADILPQLATVRVLSDKSIVGLQLVDPPDGDWWGCRP